MLLKPTPQRFNPKMAFYIEHILQMVDGLIVSPNHLNKTSSMVLLLVLLSVASRVSRVATKHRSPYLANGWDLLAMFSSGGGDWQAFHFVLSHLLWVWGRFHCLHIDLEGVTCYLFPLPWLKVFNSLSLRGIYLQMTSTMRLHYIQTIRLIIYFFQHNSIRESIKQITYTLVIGTDDNRSMKQCPPS